MSKQSSVEWLIDQLENTIFYSKEAKQNTIEQAKAMHRQEIEEAFKHGELPPLFVNFNAKDYYTQTFEQ